MQAGYEYDDDPGQARSYGLRRLSRLTWRATQLSALATVAFAALFARTAPAATVSHHPAAPKATARPSPSPAPTATPGPSAHRHRRHHHHKAPAGAPGTTAPAPSPSQSLAPPTTPPAAPPPSPTPSPVHSTSSPSHGGG